MTTPPPNSSSPANSGTGMRLKFWGVRGSIPTPGPTTVHYGGNTSCLELRVGDQIIILDAGTGLRLLGRQLTSEFGRQPLDLTLLLTHTHWDHIQGLPFFLPFYQPQNRLRLLGYEGARDGLERVLSNQMERPFFPVGMHELPANVRIEELKEQSFRLGTVEVRACPAVHPGVCVGYRLSALGRSMAFFPDNELGPINHGSAPKSRTPERRRLEEFLHGVDVLVMDSQYDNSEYQQHVGWGHGCLEEVVRLALATEVKRLYLFHHDPDHDDSRVTQMVKEARDYVASCQASLPVEAAREGLVVDV